MHLRTIVLAGITFSLVMVSPGSARGEDWPQWRGPDRTDLARETGLLKSWPGTGPRRVWLYRQAGAGYSGPAIAGGKLFTMGTRGGKTVLLSLDANTGQELWSTPMGEVLQNGWGDGPRSTPTVDGDRVYAMSGSGDLVCARTGNGQMVWRTSMEALGGKVPNWGYAESVLVDGNQVVCTPGGSQGALAALDKMTGKVLWRSTGFTDDAQYVSMIAAEHKGVRQYIQLTMKTLVGISAKDGKLLWSAEWPGRTAVIPTPIYRDGFVYVTTGYGVGCMLVEITDGPEPRVVYKNRVMKNHHGGVILLGDHFYGYSDGPGWICQDFKSGEEVWSSKDLGKGAVGYADGMFYCLDEATGAVALVEASPVGWSEKSRFTLDPQTTIRSPSGRIWTHPVIVNGKLYLRDQDLIYCYDVKQ